MCKVKIINPNKTFRKRKIRFLLQKMMEQLRDHYVTTKFLKYAIKRISKYHEKHYDLFTYIEIETINRCNETCPFCPVNKNVEKRTFAKMDEFLFRKIIDELAELNYSNRIALYSNNEPYLDKYIIYRIEYARKKCPDAFIFLYTNGTLLNMRNLLQSIDAGLDKILINNYNDALELNDNIKEIVIKIEKPQYMCYLDKIEIHLRKKTVVASNRGGKAPNKSVDNYKQYMTYRDVGCTLPFRQMVVRSSGEISLCCNDALGEITLGDVRKQDLKEIWNGLNYRKLRKELLKRGRKNLKVCNICDVADIGLTNLSLIFKYWRRNYV